MTSILTEAWVAPTIIIIALVILIGNLSTFQKSAYQEAKNRLIKCRQLAKKLI